jgi:hypothetical protein
MFGRFEVGSMRGAMRVAARVKGKSGLAKTIIPSIRRLRPQFHLLMTRRHLRPRLLRPLPVPADKGHRQAPSERGVLVRF